MTMLKPTMKHPLTETNNLKDVRKMRQRKIENEQFRFLMGFMKLRYSLSLYNV